MVYYIRFLKPPKAVPATKTGPVYVKTVLTIATDLGDDFYGAEAELKVRVISRTGEDESVQLACETCTWRVGSRALPLEVLVKNVRPSSELCLNVSRASLNSNSLQTDDMPEIAEAWSDYFRVEGEGASQRMICRRFALEPHPSLCIWEESGESIARHVWDAGLALVASIREAATFTTAIHDSLSKLIHQAHQSYLRIVELGSGCGIVGIALAQIVPHCDITLTDLPEAMDILDVNINEAKCQAGSTLRRCVLSWDEDLHTDVSQPFDLVLISDCIYNSDSHMLLVKTLVAIAQISPKVLILMATKERHSSEAEFYGLMDKAGFATTGRNTIILPDLAREQTSQDLEQVDIYTFEWSNA